MKDIEQVVAGCHCSVCGESCVPDDPAAAAPVDLHAAAPGIDLAQFKDLIGFAAWSAINLPETDPRRDFIRQASELLALIDASPKGGSIDNVTRAAFQRWAVSQNLSVTRSEVHIGMGGDYVDSSTSHAWQAWQAAIQATSAEVGA